MTNNTTTQNIAEIHAPSFKPEGEFDYYRSNFRRLETDNTHPDDTSALTLKIQGHGDPGTKWLNISPRQAEHILKYLSATQQPEQKETGR